MRQEAKRRKTNSLLATRGGSPVGTDPTGHNYTGHTGRAGGSDDGGSPTAPNTVLRTVLYGTATLTPLRGAEQELALEGKFTTDLPLLVLSRSFLTDCVCGCRSS